MIWTRRWSRNNKEELQRLEKDQEAIRKNDMETKKYQDAIRENDMDSEDGQETIRKNCKDSKKIKRQ